MPLIAIFAALVSSAKMAPLLAPALHESTAGMCEAIHANVSVPADPFVDARMVLLVDGRRPEDSARPYC